MTQGHQKIRFRRGEITQLHAFPSARTQPKRHLRLSDLNRWSRLVAIGLAGAGAAFVALVAIALAIGSFGFGTERLTAEAQAAISRLTGQEVHTRIGPARVSLDQASLVALEVRDLAIAQAGMDADVVQAGKLSFGVRILPLFTGRLELGSATLSDARLDLAAWKGSGDRDWRATLAAGGVIEPDAILDAAFAGIHAAIDSLGNSAAAGFNLTNIEIALPAGTALDSIVITSARISRESYSTLALSGEVAFGDRILTFEGKASRPGWEHSGAQFTLHFASEPDREIALLDYPEDPDGPQFALGEVDATLRGIQPAKAGRGTITATIEIGESLWKTRNAEPVSGGAGPPTPPLACAARAGVRPAPPRPPAAGAGPPRSLHPAAARSSCRRWR